MHKFTKTDCYSHCPNCGAGGSDSEDIEWHKLESDEQPYYVATCKVCGCEFHEVYKYACTVYDEPQPVERSTDEEIESILNPDDKSEDWPEFETIKDGVTSFMEDLPIEVYEHLYRASQQKQDKLIEHLLAFKG